MRVGAFIAGILDREAARPILGMKQVEVGPDNKQEQEKRE
jgi:hypothetical protein